MAKFDNILGTVGNTPVVRLNKIAPAHVKVYVKIEAFNPLGSVKDRLALGIIEDAERSGTLKPGQTVVEATSGNTGIGLAMVCAQKGYPLVVVMAESFSLERRRLMRFLGAKVVLTPARQARQRHARQGRRARREARLVPARASSRTRPTPTCTRAPRRGRSSPTSRASASTTSSPATAPAARSRASPACCARSGPRPRSSLCEPDNAQLVGSGVPQPRDADGVPSASHPTSSRTPCRAGRRTSSPSSPGTRSTLKLADRILPVERRGRDAAVARARAEGGHLRRHHRPAPRSPAACKVAADAPEGTVILCMLPDTGERYLSTPLFADIPTDMTEEEHGDLAVHAELPVRRAAAVVRARRAARRLGPAVLGPAVLGPAGRRASAAPAHQRRQRRRPRDQRRQRRYP